MSQITIDTIDEKLAELKLTKEIPNYSAILSGFSWTREWFSSIEEVLLVLAFRGESDQSVLDFIRAKLRETDIITFNRILRKFDAEPIRNHYEMALEDSSGFSMINNKNRAVVSALLEYYIDITTISNQLLSLCSHDKVVEYLIANPERIDWEKFTLNENIRAIKYCISKNRINQFTLSNCADDEIVDYLIANPQHIDYIGFSQNPNDKAVDYMWNHPQRYLFSLSKNKNDRVVDWIFEDHDRRAAYPEFYKNKNIKVAEYLMQTPQPTYYFEQWEINLNSDKYANFLIQQGQKDSSILTHLFRNSSDTAANYIIANQDTLKMPWSICENYNDMMVDYYLEKMYKWGCLFCMYKNPCTYDMQKLRAFNKLGLFPRLPHLQV